MYLKLYIIFSNYEILDYFCKKVFLLQIINKINKMTEIPSVDSTTFKRLRPRQYLERYLTEKIRVDGRKFDQFRETHLNKGNECL